MTLWLETLWQDLRFGARTLRKNRGFALAAMLTLALGIGGNTAIFSITSAVLLKSLPYRDPAKLVRVDIRRKEGGSQGFSLNRYEQVRDRNRSFAGLAVFANDSANLTGRGEPRQVSLGRVSPNFFDLLGVKMQSGHAFSEADGRPESKPVVIVSNALWRARFADRDVLNETINLDSTPYTIIGVLPADIHFPFMAPVDVWSPRYFEHSLFSTQRLRMGVGYLDAIARLQPDASMKSANAEMALLSQQFSQENPKAPDVGPNLAPLVANLQEVTVANVRPLLMVLSCAVGLVLLIACANVASLLLSRALARRKEIAVRTALGARRSAILRQLLTESVLLALLAGGLGFGLSLLATRSLASWSVRGLPDSIPVAPDAGVLLFTLALSVVTGIVFGFVPALQLARTDVNSTLRDESSGATGGHSRARLKSLLVVGQVALSLLLLIAAGLLMRSFERLLAVNPGFDPDNVLTMNVSLPTVKYADAQTQTAFFDELLRRVAVLPGVRSAAISAALPLTPKRITPMLPEGQPEVPLAERPFIIIEATSPGFLDTMHIQLRAGRAFTDADNAQAPKVIIVNEALARRFWPGQDPVGKHILIGRQPAPSEIVGVAANVKNNGLATDPQEQVYLPFAQLPWGNMNLLLRTAADPHSMAATVRAQIAAVDPDQPVTNVQTVEELMDVSRAQPRFMMALVVLFSALALTLAMVGIYGVMAYTVAQRRQELGIRLALGAEKSDILRLVVRQGLTLTALGTAIGLALALALSFIFSRAASDLLYKVGPRDVTTFAVAPLMFMMIALAASYAPARRATRVDPTEALRHG